MITIFTIVASNTDHRYCVTKEMAKRLKMGSWDVAEYCILGVIRHARESNSKWPLFMYAVDPGHSLLATEVFTYGYKEFEKRSDEYIYKHIKFVLENFE